MNAVLKDPATAIPQLFARLAAKAPEVAQTTAAQRADKLRRLLAATLGSREAIIAAVRKELRVHPIDIDGQLLMVKTEAEFAIRNVARWMQDEPVAPSLMTIGKKSYVRYEPKGVVLHVSTWNAPIAEAFVPAIGAIAAGCPFVLKPSELAPHCSKLLAEIVAKVFPPDEFAVVEGGADVAQELLRQPFNHIFYIGGHAVGRLIMKAAADHFATVTLEMGGKNPVIVDRTADLEDAATKIGWGRVANAGQVCVAPDYALVHESVLTAFVDALGRRLTAMYNADGKGFGASPELARIVNARHFQRVKALYDDALAKGARVEFGGQMNEADLFVAPTILTGLRPEMKIMQDEIFAPILCVLPFGRREDIVQELRRHLKPLSSYVFSRDREFIDWAIAHTTSGNTVVNHNLIQSGTNTALAFGGVNASGIGRLGGRATFLECSNARSIVEDGKGLGDPNMMFPPYTEKYRQALDWMLNKGVNVPPGVLRAIDRIVRAFARN
jgi:aldehyde dehydrogenase (NAD+)